MRKPKAQSELAIEMLCTFARYDTIVSHIGVLLHTAPAVVATTSTTLLVAAPAIVLSVNPMHPTIYASRYAAGSVHRGEEVGQQVT